MATFDDLPPDVLSLILSKISNPIQRFSAPPLVCKALAAAASGPSLAWGEFIAPRLHDPRPRLTGAAWKTLKAGLEKAATSVRILNLDARWLSQRTRPKVLGALAACAPYLEQLALPGADADLLTRAARAPFTPALASASRLTRLVLNDVEVRGPPGMLAAAAQGLVSFVAAPGRGTSWRLTAGDASPFLRLHRSIMAAANAAQLPIVLTRLDKLDIVEPNDPGAPTPADVLAAAGVRGLTSLGVLVAGHGADPVLDRILLNQPALRALKVQSGGANHVRPALLDLSGVAGLRHLTSLTSVSQHPKNGCELVLSPSLCAGVVALGIDCGYAETSGPPACLRGAGGLFSRLKHLCYGFADLPETNWGSSFDLSLADWADTAFSIPTLVTMDVIGRSFTLDGAPGRAWAACVARNLPRLQCLTFVQNDPFRHDRLNRLLGVDQINFACRLVDDRAAVFRFNTNGAAACVVCGSRQACLGASEVRSAILADLPEAYAATGRRARLVVSGLNARHLTREVMTIQDDKSGVQVPLPRLDYSRARQ